MQTLPKLSYIFRIIKVFFFWGEGTLHGIHAQEHLRESIKMTVKTDLNF